MLTHLTDQRVPSNNRHEQRSLDRWLAQYFRRLRRSGRGWVALCPGHDDAHHSLSIGIGDNGRLLVYCHVGCLYWHIVNAAKIPHAALDVSGVNHSHTRGLAERIAYARRFWENSGPAIGTKVEKYLRTRGIAGPVPPALRYLPALPHREFGHHFPAMVAGVQDVAGKFVGVNITWLSAGADAKAPVDPPRKTFGPVIGAAVRLAPATDRVVLAEGVETALSVMQATTIPAWAGLGVNGLRCIELPESIVDVVIAADADRAGIDAAEFLRKRLLAETRRVHVALPSVGNDFNEETL